MLQQASYGRFASRAMAYCAMQDSGVEYKQGALV